MLRPNVDVVVPFAGSAETLARVVARLEGLALRDADTASVVDNRPVGDMTPFPPSARVRRVDATGRQSSYYARNRGARAGTNPWIVFLDSDVAPPPDLIEGLFTPPPGERTGVLAGGIRDEEDEAEALVAAIAGHASLGHDVTLGRGRWAYAQTANCAVRRAAFEAVGGFADAIRSGGDADLCFRLRDAGWALELRDHAVVVHHGRRTLLRLAGQKARHGAGAAWLERRWPGSMPSEPARSRAAFFARELVPAGKALVRGDREQARAALVAPTSNLAFALGRWLSNDAPAGRRASPLARWLR